MRIKIYEKAAAQYIARCYRHARPDCGQLHLPAYADMLRAIQGKWIEVETEHLFSDQFNTAPIPGVSENGMRIMIESVEEIEGDVRPGVVKCNWCYGYGDGTGKCAKCGKSDYLEPLKVVVPYKNQRKGVTK